MRVGTHAPPSGGGCGVGTRDKPNGGDRLGIESGRCARRSSFGAAARTVHFWWSSCTGRMMDALAPAGDEGRGKLR